MPEQPPSSSPEPKPDHSHPHPEAEKRMTHRALWFIWVFLAMLAVLAFLGIGARLHQKSRLSEEAADQEPSVSVIHPATTGTSINLVLPGQTEAYTQAGIYAQTVGYLKSWNYDIGAKVKKGDVLAEIDTPTVDQQLAQAEAELSQSEATLRLAQATYTRNKELLTGKVISQQDFDNSTRDLQANQSNVNAATANVNQLRAQQAFKVLRAPFDGIVSARNTDVGALINTGTNSPLFVVSQIAPLRVYIQVPETLAAEVKIGENADLSFDSYPGRSFPAEVVATAGAIDTRSRTLLTQLSVPNESEELFPGSYTRVHLHLPNLGGSLTIPANTLLFRSEGAAVAVVNNDQVEIRNIKIARDLGAELQVSGGITANDQVVVNPSDSLNTGDKVRIAPAPQTSPTPQP